jgi:hypothetical protein
VTCLLLFLIGIAITAHKTKQWEVSREEFLKDDFQVIAVYEDNFDAQQQILRACKGHYSDTPISTFEGTNETRELFELRGKIDTNGLPVPMYLQRTSSGLAPIYAIFKGPGASDKVRRWAKDNGYEEWNFKTKWENHAEVYTKEVKFEKGISNASIVAFYTGENERMYVWDGIRVRDVSSGLTGQAGNNSDSHYRNYIAWLQNFAR